MTKFNKSEYDKRHYLENIDHYKRQRRERYLKLKAEGRITYKAYDPSDHVRNIYQRAQKRARAIGVDFKLSKEDIIIPLVCPITNLTICLGPSSTRENRPSIDRIDTAKGYTKDNIRIISNRANRLKSDASEQELINLALYAQGKL